MEKQTSVYLLTASLVVNLGLGATLSGAGVSEVRASQREECRPTNTPLSVTQKVCFESCLDSVVCPDVDSALGLSGVNACNAAKHAKSFCIGWQRGNSEVDADGLPTSLPDIASLSGTTCHAGTWTPGQP